MTVAWKTCTGAYGWVVGMVSWQCELICFVITLSQAYNKGKTFKGRALKISWYRPPAPPAAAGATTPTTPTTPTALKKVEEEFGLDIDELVSIIMAV